ncbi:glycosyltransferase family 87 protein [Novosphingobium sp. ZN18A2]|uniref:glycosyltransferase family 87 protein n=1 Tax=Novosphingobium sp. ZN18A2 TaxID=3079861 RepID=UPI0030D465D8
MTSNLEPMRHRSTFFHALVSVLAVIAALALQWSRHVNHDVAYLTWVADKVMHGAIFGIDIREINPPLSFILYWPAAWLAQWFTYDLAIKVWIAGIALFSLTVLERTAPEDLRLPLLIAFGAFLVMGYPREFGQREEIAMFLTAPYVIGPAERRGWNVVSGIMAGIAACIKPHFLLVPVLLLAQRRRINAAEWALALTGFAYAVLLIMCFRPYLEVMLPSAVASYSGVQPADVGFQRLGMATWFVMLALALAVIASDAKAVSLGLAALGFAGAAALQAKLFPYHFLAAWGFALASLVVTAVRRTGMIRAMAGATIALVAVYLGILIALPWQNDIERRERDIPVLLREIDRADSFLVISDYPYPAFPTAIYTRTPYLGSQAFTGAIPSVAALETGQDPSIDPKVKDLALYNALTDLRKNPDLVIVNGDWSSFPGLKSRNFDGLKWLNRHPAFHRLWKNYHIERRIGNWTLYRRAVIVGG